MGDTVLYFAYGSCMFKQRLDKPSAKLKAIAKLEGYKLDFVDYSDEWLGCWCSMAKGTSSDYLWGVVWEISHSELDQLNVQEGVTTGQAKILEVEVISNKGEKLRCKAYQRTLKDVPKKPMPSPQYLDLIIRGCLQNGIPDDYLNKIKMIETNHNSEKVPAYEESMMRLFKRR